MEKKWVIWQDENNRLPALQNELRIAESLCKLLIKRGVYNFAAAELFFRPSLDQLHNPFLMKDMQKAVDRILVAIRQKQNILIYGDYDVDGTTSVAVLVDFFKNFHDSIDFYIPHRFKEGYGVSAAGIQFAIDNKFDLIITIDCGIKSSKLISKANLHQIDVIICDHHLPDENDLPNALAILNPKQMDCFYPYKELCGCGIGFKLISAIEKTMFDEQNLCYNNLDLVATAIAADIVPINGENRIIAYYGLQKANKNPCIAIQSLKQCTQFEKEFTISDLVFILAPRINAAGRMDDAKTAVQLFLSKTILEADRLTILLNENNADRKDADKQTTAEALSLLDLEDKNNCSTILYKSDWHKGVVGIVASRLIEYKFQPTIILTESENKITGSARSIPGLNLFEALNACSDYLITYGGHYFAAGLTLSHDNLLPFKMAFNNYAQQNLLPEDFIPKLHIDTEILFSEISPKFFDILKQMEPFGPQNLRPVFVSKNVRNFNNGTRIVKDKHIKFELEQNNCVMKGIGFGMFEKYEIVQRNEPFHIAYTLNINEFRGVVNIEMQVIDIMAI
jgi:single-stranded-DNA-specific exonuclease